MEDIIYNSVSQSNKIKYKDQCFTGFCISPLSPTNFVKSISDIKGLTDSQLLSRINAGKNVNTD